MNKKIKATTFRKIYKHELENLLGSADDIARLTNETKAILATIAQSLNQSMQHSDRLEARIRKLEDKDQAQAKAIKLLYKAIK